MKKTLMLMLGCLALSLPAVALEKRTFTSSDGAKSFEGVLTDYDAAKKLVTIRKSGSRTVTFGLNHLSEADIAYVKENANAVVAAKAIRVDFDLWKGKPQTNRTDTERTTTTPAGYDIELRNWTKKNISNVEVRYTIFHRKDAENGVGSIAQTQGAFHVSTLFANSDDPNRTEPVNLVRYARQKSGGG